MGSHVNHLGLTGQKDWQLKTTILDGDWMFITNSGVDFRGPAESPGSPGVYAGVPLHAGLVCVDAPGGTEPGEPEALFALILSNLEEHGDLTNQILRVTLSTDGPVVLIRYAMSA